LAAEQKENILIEGVNVKGPHRLSLKKSRNVPLRFRPCRRYFPPGSTGVFYVPYPGIEFTSWRTAGRTIGGAIDPDRATSQEQ
jgi:hypothetical protein